MTFRRLAPRIVALASAFLVAACASSGPTGGPTGGPSAAAPTDAALPSFEVPTFDDGTFAIPSFAIPSFASDHELEALLPDTIGGNLVVKVSMTGQGIMSLPGGAAIEDQLDDLGATADDVSVAIGTTSGGTGPVVVFAYRIAGVSAEQVFEGLEGAMQAGQGGEVTKTTVAGRSVTQVTSAGETTYIYLASDVLFIVGGQLTPALLQDAISQLPAA